MKQVLQSRSGLVVVRDVAEPKCATGAVLVRNFFSAISSGTERSRVVSSQKSILSRARDRPDLVREVAQRARREGLRATREAVQRKLDEEVPVGYSSAGRVVKVGAAVRGLRVGDAVACAGAGRANHAEIVSVPRNLCARVPEGVPLENASLTTIAAIALHGIRLAEARVGERVAVVGCGLVGQIACRLLHAAGAEIYALDIDPARVEQAIASGADHPIVADSRASELVMAASAGAGMDAVIVTAAAPTAEPLDLAVAVARDRGAVVLVGDVPVQLPRAPLYEKELSFRISRSYGPGRYDAEYEERGLDYPIGYVRWTLQRNMESVLDLQARGLVDFTDLVELVPVDEARAAYARLTADASDRPRGALILSFAETTEASDSLGMRTGLPSISRAEAPATAPQVGLIGPGGFASSILIPAFVRAGARLELVGGGSGPSANAAQRSHGFARTAPTDEAVIEDPNVDAIVIATRHQSHATLAMHALKAGKHVFCEKPLALNERELTAVIDAAEVSRRILLVGFNRRFSPLLKELCEFATAGGVPLVVNYRVSAGSIPHEHWVHDLEQGGGRIIGEVCHFVDSLVFLSGALVTSVAAAAHVDAKLPLQARDNVVVTITLSDGSIGAITYTAAGSGRIAKERLEVFSGSRTAILDDYRTLELYDGEHVQKRDSRRQDKGHDAEVSAFIEAIRTGVPPAPLDEIANVSLATLAVVESLKSGASIAVSRPAS